MKSAIKYAFLAFFTFLCITSSAQVVIDLRTGVYNGTNTIIPYNNVDDTWTVCPPHLNPAIPTSFSPVFCGSGAFTPSIGVYYNPLDPAVGWLSPDMLPTGEHVNSAYGVYYYKTEFTLDANCTIQSAVFNFATIGGDDLIEKIYVNGREHNVSFGWNPLDTGITLPIPASNLLPGANTIMVRVYNWTAGVGLTTPTGLQINGNLTINIGANASFIAGTPTNGTLVASSNFAGSHAWEIFSSPTGNTGTYTHIGSYDTPDFQLTSAGPCYLIYHSISNDCGNACTAQKVCYQNCQQTEPTECSALTPPTNLVYNSIFNFLSWTPVPGAISYDIELTANDPGCCRGTASPLGFRSITTLTNTHVINWANLGFSQAPSCFSWQVIARCENGIRAKSEVKCAFPGSAANRTAGQTTTGNIASTENMKVIVYPNPAKELITIDIETLKATTFNVTIEDINGKTIKAFNKLRTDGNTYKLTWNAESAATGIYLVKVKTQDNQVLVQKIIIE